MYLYANYEMVEPLKAASSANQWTERQSFLLPTRHFHPSAGHMIKLAPAGMADDWDHDILLFGLNPGEKYDAAVEQNQGKREYRNLNGQSMAATHWWPSSNDKEFAAFTSWGAAHGIRNTSLEVYPDQSKSVSWIEYACEMLNKYMASVSWGSNAPRFNPDKSSAQVARIKIAGMHANGDLHVAPRSFFLVGPRAPGNAPTSDVRRLQHEPSCGSSIRVFYMTRIGTCVRRVLHKKRRSCMA